MTPRLHFMNRKCAQYLSLFFRNYSLFPEPNDFLSLVN